MAQGIDAVESRVLLSMTPFLVENIQLGTGSSWADQPSNPSMVDINGILYFAANDGIHGVELWRSDGTAAGTWLVSNIASNGSDVSVDSNPTSLTVVDGYLYFEATRPGTGYALWRYNPASDQLVKIKDLGMTNIIGDGLDMAAVEGTLFFTANEPGTGTELWKTSPSTNVATLVEDIRPGTAGSTPTSLRNVNGVLMFSAYGEGTGREPWRSSGSAINTELIKDINLGSSGSGNLADAAVVGNFLYFIADDGVTGRELWRTNGTFAGTTRVHDIVAGNGSSDPYHLTNSGGTLYFGATNITHGQELWKVAPGANSAVLLKDILGGTPSSSPDDLIDHLGTLYFTASNGNHRRLWKSDGTGAGTVLVKATNPTSGFPYGNVDNLFSFNGYVFFTETNTALNGRALWRSDGTANGTIHIMDIDRAAGTGNFVEAPFLSAAGDRLFFFADVNTAGRELWTLDVPRYHDDLFLWNETTDSAVVGASTGSTFQFSNGPSWAGLGTGTFFRGDFNDDGLDDVLGMNAARQLWVALGSASGLRAPSLWGTWAAGHNASDVRVGDFNGDGRDDLVAKGTDGRLRIQRSTGSAFTLVNGPGLSPTAYLLNESVVGDFDGDGKDDIAVRQTTGDWYVGYGTATSLTMVFAGRWNEGYAWTDLRVGDFNGDGKDDIIARAGSGGLFALQFPNGRRFTMRQAGRWNPALMWTDVSVGDFNGDGKDDIAAWEPRGIWWVTLGSTTSSPVQAFGRWNPAVNWYSGVGDFNRDGFSDIVGVIPGTGRVWTLLGSPTGFGATTFFGSTGPIPDGQLLTGLFV